MDSIPHSCAPRQRLHRLSHLPVRGRVARRPRGVLPVARKAAGAAGRCGCSGSCSRSPCSHGVPLAVARTFSSGWFWYLGTLIPVIGLVQVGSQAHADRYTYLPLVGIFMIVGLGPREHRGTLAPRARTLVVTLALASAAACIATTSRQLPYWQQYGDPVRPCHRRELRKLHRARRSRKSPAHRRSQSGGHRQVRSGHAHTAIV